MEKPVYRGVNYVPLTQWDIEPVLLNFSDFPVNAHTIWIVLQRPNSVQ